MNMPQSAATAAAVKPAQSLPQSEADLRNDVRNHLGNSERVSPASQTEAAPKTSGYGLPCAKCRLYYPANLDACPTCDHKERVAANVVPVILKPQVAVEPVPDTDLVEQEREAFLKQFKSQLFAAHAEVTNAPVACTLGDHRAEDAEPASICKPCYDHLQERIDVCEAALHIDLKDAAQIIYDAVWADPSDPSKTYTNAASAILTELRKRAGISSMIGPFQPLGN
ncbi:MAG: hypothetical protein WCC95_04750 [Candidatus Sulfotelmatobacter sp.]|jgi:hypothetical protein